MVKIEFNKETSLVELDIYGDSFFDATDYCGSINLNFDKKKKVWTCFPKEFLDKEILYNIKKESGVIVDRQILRDIKKSAEIKLDLITPRLRYNPDIVNFTPLKGLPPNEDYQLTDIKKVYLLRLLLFI